MNRIIVFLDGYEVFKGSVELFKSGVSGDYLDELADRVVEEEHVIDSEQGDFELFTMEAFIESGFSHIDMEIRGYERQLEDCHEDYIQRIKDEIEELKRRKKEEEGK